jgi:hypothetical protein
LDEVKRFNLNYKIYVQIREEGWELLRKTKRQEYIDVVIGRNAVTIENELWYELQGHEVLSLFGGINTNISPIGIEIMFNDKDLK